MLILVLLFVELLHGIEINNQFREEPKDIQTIVGSTLVFRCRTEPIDESEVTWCKNDFCTLGKTRDLPFYPRYEIIGHAHQGEHHFKIVNVSLEDLGVYQCQIRAGPRRPGSMSRKAKLTILQTPTSFSLDRPIVLIENVLSFVVCRASNGMPEATLTWNLPPSLHILSKTDYALISDHSLRNSISNITFIPQLSDHGKVIECQAHSSAIRALNRTFITREALQVSFPPRINLTSLGVSNEKQRLTLLCQIDSRPNGSQIEWFNGTDRLNRTDQSRMEISLTRSMHLNQISCQATNQIGRTTRSITLRVNYRPRFIDAKGNPLGNASIVLVKEGESIQLECFVDSYPISTISWRFNGRVLLANGSVLYLNRIEMNKDLGQYLCLAQHPIFGRFSRTIRLILKNPPEILQEKKSYSAFSKHSVRIVCQISKDLPLQNLYWSREDQKSLHPNEKYQIHFNESSHFIQSELTIENLSSKDEGFYLCTTTNQYGSSIAKYQLKVAHLQDLLIRNWIFYGSIVFGVFLSFLFIFLILINSYKHNRKMRTKSSTTDQTISSVNKQANQQDFSDETTSSVEQYLIQNHHKNQEKLDEPSEGDLFYFENKSKRFSTVV